MRAPVHTEAATFPAAYTANGASPARTTLPRPRITPTAAGTQTPAAMVATVTGAAR